MWVGCFLTALTVFAVVEGSDDLHGRGQTCPGHCGLAVVGAGAGGAYAAWRVAKDNGASVAAKDVCVFERSERVGGECVCGVRALKDLLVALNSQPHDGCMACCCTSCLLQTACVA
jgi:hypothetical protein